MTHASANSKLKKKPNLQVTLGMPHRCRCSRTLAARSGHSLRGWNRGRQVRDSTVWHAARSLKPKAPTQSFQKACSKANIISMFNEEDSGEIVPHYTMHVRSLLFKCNPCFKLNLNWFLQRQHCSAELEKHTFSSNRGQQGASHSWKFWWQCNSWLSCGSWTACCTYWEVLPISASEAWRDCCFKVEGMLIILLATVVLAHNELG